MLLPGLSGPIMASVTGSLPANHITIVGSTSTTSSTITLPAEMQEGDFVLLFTAVDDYYANILSVPSGWTQAWYTIYGDLDRRCIWKRMGPVPDTSVASLTSGDDITHIAVAFRGVHATNPFDATTQTGATASFDCAAITTENENALVVCHVGQIETQSGSQSISGAPANYTMEKTAVETGWQEGCTSGVAYREIAEPGVENPGSFTSQDGSSLRQTTTMALRPIPPG